MGIKDVEEVILGLRAARDEWDKADLGYWREVDTVRSIQGIHSLIP